MDFVVGIPRTRRQHDSIWVIVDRLTKSVHFIPVKSTYRVEDYARLYIDEMAWDSFVYHFRLRSSAYFTFLEIFQEKLGNAGEA